MNRVLAVALLASILFMTAPAFGAAQASQAAAVIAYPQTRTVDVIEDHFGVIDACDGFNPDLSETRR